MSCEKYSHGKPAAYKWEDSKAHHNRKKVGRLFPNSSWSIKLKFTLSNSYIWSQELRNVDTGIEIDREASGVQKMATS